MGDVEIFCKSWADGLKRQAVSAPYMSYCQVDHALPRATWEFMLASSPKTSPSIAFQNLVFEVSSSQKATECEVSELLDVQSSYPRGLEPSSPKPEPYAVRIPETSAGSLRRYRQGPTRHIHRRILETPWFLKSHLSWALEPQCRILVFVWSLGPLLIPASDLDCLAGQECLFRACC